MAARTGGAGADVFDAAALDEDDEINRYFGRAGDDTLTGGGLKDTLDGGAGSDQLFGDDGSDVLRDTARVGADLLEGGAGDDTIEARYGADTLSGGAGDDSITFGFGAMLVRGGRSDDLFYSIGDAASTATVLGGSGDDVLYAGASRDVFAGGQGEDLVDYGAATSAIVVNLATGLGAGAAVGDSYDLVEDVTGSQGNDVLIGDGAYNVLRGGAGADTIGGGFGGDYLDGGAGFDILNLAISDLQVFFSLATGEFFERVGEGRGDTFRNFEGVVGSSNGDRLIGDTAANRLIGLGGDDQLDGGGGADTLEGGAGNDTYFADDLADRVVETADGGVDTLNATVNYTLVDDFVEILALVGPNALVATGNSRANTILGNELDNVLDGGEGADVLRGGLGDDTYYVDDSNDDVFEADEVGSLDEIITSVNLNTTLRPLGDVERITLAGDDDLRIAVRFFQGDVVGNSGDNFFSAFGGGTLIGAAGADTFFYPGANEAAGFRDFIADFTPGEDKIQLTGERFRLSPGELDPDDLQIGGSGPVGGARLIYRPEDGALIGVARNGDTKLITVLTSTPDISADDFIIV